MNWTDAIAIHREAAAAFAAAAGRVSADAWRVPRADGKWSPAEIVEHVSLTYDVLLRELAGGGGMQIRTKLWQRLLLRLTVMPKILRGKGFPAGARAPREVRPPVPSSSKDEAIVGFRDRGARFVSAAEEVHRTRPRARLTHAYFGTSTVANAVLLCARHLDHHRQQLPG